MPWQDVIDNHETYVDDQYLPEGVNLKDPEKLRSAEVDKLLAHWRDKQSRPSDGPVFLWRRYKDTDNKICRPDRLYSEMQGSKGKGKAPPPPPPSKGTGASGSGQKVPKKGKGKAKAKESEDEAEESGVEENDDDDQSLLKFDDDDDDDDDEEDDDDDEEDKDGKEEDEEDEIEAEKPRKTSLKIGPPKGKKKLVSVLRRLMDSARLTE